MAQDQHSRAIGIVLSGTGSDGAVGVQAIKKAGGLVIVQDPESAEFDGMPCSAIATGVVDFTLLPAAMAAQLLACQFGRLDLFTLPKTDGSLTKILLLLRSQTGHDFSQYKPRTIHRRIERRMAIHQIEAIDDYVQYFQQTPAEAQMLFRDLLIGVTNFFRDPEAFQALDEQIIPKLFADKLARGGTVRARVWSMGCSTGEEAYSIAILLQERMEALNQSYTVQVFATDIDSEAITTARAGFYPASIAANISPQRLARFFTTEPNGAYRIQKNIRNMLVFSEHDAIKDPPFSKLDLISCRNLLIYFDAELQKKIIPMFHYALNPGGMLFLGTSEGVGDFGDLFAVLNHKAKLYQRKEYMHGKGKQRASLAQFLPYMKAMNAALSHNRHGITIGPVKRPLRELTEEALQQIGPAAVLVTEQGDILYLHGRTGQYLEPPMGEVGIFNLLKMAREGLQRDLSMALHKAVSTHEIVRALGVRVKTNGHFTLVNLSIRPLTADAVTTPEPPLYLVVLEESPVLDPGEAQQAYSPPDSASGLESDAYAYIAALKEELESSNDELKFSNEEMQSMNEELQSTNEELETSKEELQSVNEELSTVNTELQTKVTDLLRSNDDMNNLLAGTGIATIFVDLQLRILRFTPTAGEIINVIPTDVGRPVGHFVSNLVSYDCLVADATAVLDTLIPKQVKVRTSTGLWYMMRIRPYRTLKNVIEGAVITFVDITESKQAEEAQEQITKLLRLSVVVHDAFDAITVQDLEGRILAWNPGAEKMYGWSEAEALLMNVHDRIPKDLQADALAKLFQLGRAETMAPYRTQRNTKNGAIVDVWMIATALVNQWGQVYAVATTERVRTPEIDLPKDALHGQSK